jgi:outer membrane protein assembly factor BamE (lipoprotein component of BamABCDE complex)
MIKLKLFSILIFLLVCGCASTGNKTLGSFDSAQVTTMIKDGVTTKQEIVAMLGDPSGIDLDHQSREKWTYTHQKVTSKAINFVPIAGSFQRGTNNTVKQLIILFDSNNVVSKHIFSTSLSETNIGLLG